MISLITYLIALILELFFFAFFAVFTIFLIYSSLKGAPYVPTNKKEILTILKQAKLKKDQIFLDLGCGDGRIVRQAVDLFDIKGIGIEINPLLILWAKFLAKTQKLSNIEFRLFDIVNKDIPLANVIYLFLFPKLIEKIVPKLSQQLNNGTLIISHGFKIKQFSKFLIEKIDRYPFPTYFYRRKVNI